MDGKTLARLGAVVFVAVAITATAIEMSRKGEAPEAWPSGRTTPTPTASPRAELIHSPATGAAGPRAPACPRASAHTRHSLPRPLTPPSARTPATPPNPQAH